MKIMKLSQATPEQKIKALAELDGFVLRGKWWTPTSEDRQCMPRDLEHGNPLYLTSYDAIIPLIQKQPLNIQIKFGIECALVCKKDEWKLDLTPSQLSDATLIATGTFEV